MEQSRTRIDVTMQMIEDGTRVLQRSAQLDDYSVDMAANAILIRRIIAVVLGREGIHLQIPTVKEIVAEMTHKVPSTV